MKLVAKGQIQADNSYSYTCGTCNGAGYLLDSRRGEELCAYCYDGDYQRIVLELKTARGQRYYALLKSALKVAGKAIADTAQALRAEHGKLTMPMMGYMCLYFQLNFKALGEWLEECRIIPTGATERINESNYIQPDGKKTRFKVSYALEKGAEWWGKDIKIWRGK